MPDEDRAELEPLRRQLARTAGEYAISLVCLWAYFALQDETSWLRLELAELAERAGGWRDRLETAVIRWKVDRLTGTQTYNPKEST